MDRKSLTSSLPIAALLAFASGCEPMADPPGQSSSAIVTEAAANVGDSEESTSKSSTVDDRSSSDAVANNEDDPATQTPSPEVATSERPLERPTERPMLEVEAAPPPRAAFQFPGRQAKQQDLTFDDLKFEMEKGGPFDRSMLTEKIESLAGKEIKIRGFMLPAFQQSGITEFILVRDNRECCFGPGAALYDCIRVSMVPGKSTDYSVRPIAVKGTFEIEPFVGPDGKHLAVFHMKAEETWGG